MARSSRIVRTLTVLAAALAVLCTACGFHTVTGRRLSVTTEGPRKRPGAAGPPSAASVALMAAIKPLMLIMILGGVGFVGWKMVAWLRFDPAQVPVAARCAPW